MSANRFQALFREPKPILAMIHVPALPGTPGSQLEMREIVRQTRKEAELLSSGGVQGLLVENMHDTPYLNREVGPEIIASMTRVCSEIRQEVHIPVGVQVLAGANRAALAVAQAAGLQFIRAEGFVFGHLADEGLFQADAGELLRYRHSIDADDIQVFTDIKKKHASHALTADVDLAETARAAEFFRSDGVVVTGVRTGVATRPTDLQEVRSAVDLPILVGSGVTPENLPDTWDLADAFILGSYLKQAGVWSNPPDAERLRKLLKARDQLL